MLKFIFGRPGSGKTYTIMQLIKSDSDSGKKSLLIIPEQFSFESERLVLRTLGDKSSLNVNVCSFSRLYDEVGRISGGTAGIILGDADKVIFMNRALISVSGDLKLWSRYCKSVSFAKTMLDTVGEFKINAISSEDLKVALSQLHNNSLKDKLSDLVLIYEAYDALVGERFIDPVDKMTKLYRALENNKYFEGKNVYIDAFKGFTGQQFKIIDRIFSQTDDVTFSFTNDPDFSSDFNVFTNIRSTLQRIRKSAIKYNVKENESLFLNNQNNITNNLNVLEKIASGKKASAVKNDGTITICSATSLFDEAEFTARAIRSLVRKENYRYKDFVIIARDSSEYEHAIKTACEKNHVRCFSDTRTPLSANPVTTVVSSVCEAAIIMTTDNIFKFLKSGIGMLSTDEIAVLENYTTIWNIDGEMWNQEWKMDTRGFVSKEHTEEIDKEKLAEINFLRVRTIKPINNFKDKFNGNARNMSEAIVRLLEECDISDALCNMSEIFTGKEQQFSQDILRQGYDKFIKILDSLVNCFGDISIDRRRYVDALSLAVSYDTVGQIPRMLDEVTFGSADKIRPSRPKVAFIIGANQGVFPKAVSNSGILAFEDRKNLIEIGIDIPDNAIESVINENYLVYSNLCCASEKVFITYSNQSLTGEIYQPAAFVSEISDNIPCNMLSEPADIIDDNNLPETKEDAYSEYCKRSDTIQSINIKDSLTDSDYNEKISYLEGFMQKKKTIISENSQKLYGNNLSMSATRINTYNSCHFSYFCKYGLKTKKIQPADFDVLQRGTIVHFVLQQLISDYKKKISDMTRENLDRLCDGYISQYLDNVSGYREIENERSKFIVSRISRSLKEVVWQISSEFRQSDFNPVSCELNIGTEVPPLNIPFDKGNVTITGSIDRVDEYNGYIRIIDYKTGNKKFKLPDVLFGLNLQMLIYLYAVVKGKNIDYKKAAGILYMPSKRDLNESGMAMNGLLQSDPDLVYAMDKERNGDYVPKYYLTKNGALDKRCTSFITPEQFNQIFEFIDKFICITGNQIYGGDIAVNPIDGRETPACKYCDYSAVCGRENESCRKVPDYKNEEVFEKLKEAGENGI